MASEGTVTIEATRSEQRLEAAGQVQAMDPTKLQPAKQQQSM